MKINKDKVYNLKNIKLKKFILRKYFNIYYDKLPYGFVIFNMGKKDSDQSIDTFKIF